MTLAELKAQLKSLGYPVAYRQFKDRKIPPYIAYLDTTDSDVMADNHNFVDVRNIDIELYTAEKDPATEAEVEGLLKVLGIPYLRYEDYLETEELFKITYEIQLI